VQVRKLSQEASGLRTWAVVLEPGDELMNALLQVASDEGITGADFTAIGACRRITLAWWDWEAKQYREQELDEQVELASLVGNIAATADGGTKVHMHGVVARSDLSARAGHVMAAECRPTIEVVLEEVPAHLRRIHDAATGLALIDLSTSG
jgi:predicted DNA-binding protein with PD1-like motif